MRRKSPNADPPVKTPPPRAGKPPAQGLRERIRREATHLIASRGFGAISVNDVALAVGISKQALLYHYPSREALHAAVLDSLIEHSNRHLLLLLGAFTDKSAERLERVMEQLREFFDTEQDAARVFLREVLDADSPHMSVLMQGMEPWIRIAVDVLRQGQREGHVRPELDPEAAVGHVGLLLLTSFAMRRPTSGWPESDEAAWRERWLGEAGLIIKRYLFAEPSPAPARRKRPRRQTK
ncbi:TetR/AcrR family transcriptional regulator [Cystobacter fuscus]|uniref:TetR/AcrR family transcriptional regulator n=1 Tax=Cystobacter fuscus TaxID=43 RepID=UPI002B2F33BC|nr:TetR/AcrR family transcriptional regulator [Cystobacter fuscus]